MNDPYTGTQSGEIQYKRVDILFITISFIIEKYPYNFPDLLYLVQVTNRVSHSSPTTMPLLKIPMGFTVRVILGSHRVEFTDSQIITTVRYYN